MASRTVRDPRGYTWTIRERWLQSVGGLPPNAWADDFECMQFWPLAVLGGLASVLVWLLSLPLALLRLGFAAPLIEAERQGEPHVKLTWRARDRQVGPKVIDRIAASVEAGDVRVEVEDATFLRFDDPNF